MYHLTRIHFQPDQLWSAGDYPVPGGAQDGEGTVEEGPVQVGPKLWKEADRTL